jgi:hypothetical protein
MVTGVGITDTIKSLSDLQVRCNLRQADSDRFFSEWSEDLPDLDERERAGIERLKQRYDYHRFGFTTVGTSRFSRSTLPPAIALRYWARTGRSRRNNSRFYRCASCTGATLDFGCRVEADEHSCSGSIAQLLAYMLANPQSERPSFGIATNGDEFVFLKLSQGDAPQYDASRTFSLFPRRHELGEVLRILKRLGQAVLE